MIKFEFSRTFTSGIFEGITQFDSISFPDRQSYDLWLKKVNEKHIDGKFNSATILTGAYTITICENQWNQSTGETPTWSAEWKEP